MPHSCPDDPTTMTPNEWCDWFDEMWKKLPDGVTGTDEYHAWSAALKAICNTERLPDYERIGVEFISLRRGITRSTAKQLVTAKPELAGQITSLFMLCLGDYLGRALTR